MADYNYNINGMTLLGNPSKGKVVREPEIKRFKGQTVKTYCVMFAMYIQNSFHCWIKSQKDFL